MPGIPYQGINVALTSPDGQLLELQFHTPTSLAVKEGAMHKLYEEIRALAVDDPRRAALNRQMMDLAATIPVPRGLDGVQ